MQLGLAWKGNKGLLGWGGIAASLDGPFRADTAYLLGHRYLRLNRRQEAESFFQETLEHAAAEADVRDLAREALDLLEQGQGRLVVSSEAEQAIPIVIQQEGKDVATIGLTTETTIDLPPGKYRLALETPMEGIQIVPAELTVLLAGTTAVTAKWHWKPGDGIDRLQGLLTAPARLPNIGRWNLFHRDVSGNFSLRVAYSPEGRWITANSSDGTVRIYDAESLQLQRILPGFGTFPFFAWSADGSKLAVSNSEDGLIVIWDAEKFRLLRRIPCSPASRMEGLAWHPEGTHADGDLLGRLRADLEPFG